ncbi:MAG: 30S ribosome-binding factor RbfA [Desulfobacterales bacterium]
MTAYSRAERVGGQIQRVLSEVLTRRVKDPRLNLVTVTAVKMSADLKQAKIYFSTGGNKEKAELAHQGFATAHGFIKRELARELGLRYMPDLKYYYDETFDRSSRINELLKSLKTNGSDHHTP